ncbi:MAG: phosphate ABC transporter ATP-binding protein PstB [Clostridia bacterium]
MNKSMIEIQDVNVWYGEKQALYNNNLSIQENSIYAFIGPSGCGKTTLLRSINRLNDLIKSFRITGNIIIKGQPIYDLQKKADIEEMRRHIGMIFQQPNPLPTSIIKNMLLPINEHFQGDKVELENLVIEKLQQAAIYQEISSSLQKAALSLSGGQQQRLCIARALMLEPSILLFDEPCSALDPISTYKIEELLMELKQKHTIVIVTHNMEQARRISDYTAFFYEGKIIEQGTTLDMFMNPKSEMLEHYISGKF